MSPGLEAAGLGRLNVQSGLGQPLRAEVEVTSLTPQEAQSLTAKLAPQQAFRQAGLEFNPALTGLKFAIESRGGKTFVRISSPQPINEPFIDLLVELNWANGKFVREYTFLLDPPEIKTAREGADAPPAAAAAPAAPRAEPAPSVVSEPRAEAQKPETPKAVPAQSDAAAEAARPKKAARSSGSGASEVTVRRGDTLGSIARNLKPEGVTLEQAMLAIYRANRDAFIADNLNLIRAGRVLNVPDSATMTSVDAETAASEIKLQASNFNQYRQQLAGAPRVVETPRAGQSATGSVSAGVTDRSAEAPGDQLRLSKPAGSGTSASVGSQASRASAGEDEVARKNALREASSRIAELEKNVTDLQKLLEMKSRSMGDLQKQLEDARLSSKALTGNVAPAPATATPAPATPAPAPAPAAVAPAPVPTEPAKVEPPVAAAPAEAPQAPAPATVEPPKAEAPVPPPVAQKPVEPPPPARAAQEPLAESSGSWFDDLLNQPFLLPAVGGAALLGAGYGWVALRRRRKVEKFEDSLIAADAFTANSLFGSTGGQSVDTSQSVFATGVGAGAVDVHSTEVDPIAEADVYIAYGREAQAEDILKEALKRQPERQAIRAKLLEIYSGRKDVRAFEVLAREMYQMTEGRNEEWPKVATLGLSIDPTNPLYGRSDDSSFTASAPSPTIMAEAAPDLGVPELPTLQIEEPAAQPEEDDIPSLDFDLNLGTGAPSSSTEPSFDAGTSAAAAPEAGRFDLPTLDLESPQSAQNEVSLDLDLPELDTLSSSPSASAAPASGMDLDLSSISLDLEPATAVADEPDAVSGGSGRWQEMATKLDLASAYEEIGDKEGARELLQEVVRGGDSGQQQKARAMLSKIG